MSEKSLLIPRSPSSNVEYVDHSKYAIIVVILNVALNFALYGFQTIYQTYFEGAPFKGIGVDKRIAGVVSALASFFVYFFALVGGVLADSYLGLFPTIIIGSIVLLAGLLSLMIGNIIVDVYIPLSFLGLSLFVIGSGLTKACTSAFLGEQFDEDQAEKRSTFYSYYYLSIQIGSIVVSVGGPILFAVPKKGGYILFALLSSAVILIVPFFVTFWKKFKRRKPGGSVYTLFLRILWAGCSGKKRRTVSDANPSVQAPPRAHWLDKAKTRFESDDVEDAKGALNVLLIFLPLIFFWLAFFQIYNLWIQQAGEMNRVIRVATNTTVGLKIEPASTTVLNPVFDLMLIPLTAKLVYPWFKKRGYELTPLRKIVVGLIFTIIACCVAAVTQLIINIYPEDPVSIFWIIPQYFFLSCGEIFLAVTIYEFAYSQAPDSMKGMVTGAMMLTIAIGNVGLALMALMHIDHAIENFVLAGLVGIVLVAFLIFTRTYTYAEDREIEEDEEILVNKSD